MPPAAAVRRRYAFRHYARASASIVAAAEKIRRRYEITVVSHAEGRQKYAGQPKPALRQQTVEYCTIRQPAAARPASHATPRASMNIAFIFSTAEIMPPLNIRPRQAFTQLILASRIERIAPPAASQVNITPRRERPASRLRAFLADTPLLIRNNTSPQATIRHG